MRYVTSVNGKVKVGCNTLLSERTLLVGPVGSGKTTVINTLELALTARASDVEGHETAAVESRLISLAPPGMPLSAKVTLNDGGVASLLIKRGPKGKGAKKAEHVLPPGIDPSLVFPLRPLRDAVNGKPETLRKFFVRESIRETTWADVLALVPQILRAKLEIVVKELQERNELAEDALPVERLTVIQAYAKKQASLAEKGAAEARQTLGAGASGLGTPPSEDDLQNARTALQQANALVETAVTRQMNKTHREEALARRALNAAALAATEAKIGEADADLTTARALLEELRTQAKPISPGVRAMAEAAIYLAAAGKTECGVCGCTPPGGFAERAVKAKARLASAKADAIDGTQWQINTIQQSLSQLMALSAQMRDALDNEPELAAEEDLPEINITDARAQVETLQAKLRSMESLASGWARASAGRSRAVQLERAALGWTELEESLTQVVTDLFTRGRENFKKRVQRYLPSGDQFDFALEESRVDFGLLGADGVLHTALSGGEWVRVTVALATACIRPDALLSIIIPEDRAWDPFSLSKAMLAMTMIPAQVVMTSTVLPAKAVTGWSIVLVEGRKSAEEEDVLPPAIVDNDFNDGF